METTVHKKSLIYSLQENKEKVKKQTILLVFFAIVIAAFLLAFAFTNITQWYAFAIIVFSSYVLYLCYTIFSLWQRHKKIKQKLNSL
jgi:4-hydroxybenzoate polyprenyltransferase